MHRAYRNLLGLHHSAVPPPQENPLTEIGLAPPVKNHLLQLLELKGQVQSGVVFGHCEHHQLQVLHFAHSSARGQSDLGLPPFHWNAAYLRGCVDTLLATHGSDIDWCGVWIAAPNSEQFSLSEIVEYAAGAYALGLVDHQQVLISVGWDNGILDLQALKFLDADTPVSVPLHL